jgi:cytochrome c-type biogenesis protein CcmF
LLLAVSAFSLSLLGTFLVRSGVLVSVHAFATDPTRGVFILMLLAFFIGGSLLLYAWRAPAMAQSGGFALVSRESFLLFNNMLLVISALLILIGTLYPLFLDALSLGKISVGPPYFATAFLIPTLPLVPLAIAALVLALAVPFVAYGHSTVLITIGVFAAFLLAGSSLLEPLRWLWQRRTLRGYPRSLLGMSLAHFGVAVFVLGVTVASAFSIERDISLQPGDTQEIAGYSFTFRSVSDVPGPNYEAVEAVIDISRDGKPVATLTPQKRVYRVQRSPMTEAAIHPRLSRDIYVALGEPLGEDAWSMRLQYKPMIRLIWLGALIMAAGGLVSATDRRYRVRKEVTVSTSAGEAVS